MAAGSIFTACALLHAADLSSVKTVYLLPMSGGLDQFLAGRLASDGAFQVVTDPKKADAIFTDRIGEGFEQTLSDLLTPKKPDDGKLENIEITRPPSQPFAHSKGSFFLVDRNSHVVLWSTYAVAKSNNSGDLNSLAVKIVAELDKTRSANPKR